MSVIKLDKLTKDYGGGRGIFDLDLTVEQGEMMGYVGTNGSGKTTTIRNILGFLKPTRGAAYVNGLSSWEHSSEIAAEIGYVPGEIAFPDLKTGVEFLKCQAEFLGLKNMNYADELIARLQLDPRANLKRMSKGMKQKTALVAALMNDAPVIILDEPTTGLDPLMRATFLDIIKEEHKKGKTIFMSSHSFEELESTCDRVAMVNDGHIVDVCDVARIKNRPEKEFKIEFHSRRDYLRFIGGAYEIIRNQEQYNQVTVKIPAADAAALLRSLRAYDVKFISELPYTLERHFKKVLIEKKEKETHEKRN
ncbi:MAG: ATP-binding cassette domain-containing protein [Candidatus Borkfalkiaceae bacterium]|nr:ATP-binding cassette domain-containing protein [Clostridia bacterium]MDY6222834.1 ATP-binding cassette domain-containing protein [Christensenellaceae bacterium]